MAAITRTCIAASAVALILAVLLAGQRDWGPAIGIGVSAVVSIAGGLAYLYGTGRKRGA